MNGWKAGDLNISGLNTAVDTPTLPAAPAQTSTGRIIQGDPNPVDIDPNTAGIQFKYDALGNVIGNGQLPGRDDELFGSAGKGTNRLYGGADADADAVAGENGKDVIFGDSEITDIAAYIQSSRSEASVNEKGDFLAGAGGDDILITGAKNDSIEAGDGYDVAWLDKGNDTYRLTNLLS